MVIKCWIWALYTVHLCPVMRSYKYASPHARVKGMEEFRLVLTAGYSLTLAPILLPDVWWAWKEVHFGIKLLEETPFLKQRGCLSKVIDRVVKEKNEGQISGALRGIPLPLLSGNKSDITLSLAKKKLWYSGRHTAEEVYSASVPSLSAGGDSCWSLHILLAALLTQNTLMTSPQLTAEPRCEVIHVSMWP